MQEEDTHCWLRASTRRHRLLATLRQPMTVTQIARVLGLSRDSASVVARQMAARGVLKCLNPHAHMSRVYWLTKQGAKCQAAFSGQPASRYSFPPSFWKSYGTVCTSHRSAVIKALDEQRCPADVKRRARFLDPELRMSANNVRDVVHYFLEAGIVKAVPDRARSHPLYELTPLGRTLQTLLLNAEVPPE